VYQMVRFGQPTGVLIPVVYLFGGEESKAKNSKVAHEYVEHREHDEFILVGESSCRRDPLVGDGCEPSRWGPRGTHVPQAPSEV
jgi:hypothetical protein